jgi:hypothetical protein
MEDLPFLDWNRQVNSLASIDTSSERAGAGIRRLCGGVCAT